MGVTAIKGIDNRTGRNVSIHCTEDPGKPAHNALAKPGQSARCNIWIPWCFGSDQWRHHHIYLNWSHPTVLGDVMYVFPPTTFYWIWQHGEFVHGTTTGKWISTGRRIPGEAGVNGDRYLVIESLDPVRVRMEIKW